MNNEIWNAAELVEEWNGKDCFGNIKYKLFFVPRSAIDEDCSDEGAHLLIGIDDGGVRRIEELFDKIADRLTTCDEIFISDFIAEHNEIPEVACKILERYMQAKGGN